MKKLVVIILLVVCLSCGKEKYVLLPEIKKAKITEVNDVSSIYIFYDETKTDSVEIKKNNILSTTNWLFNIDKRLTIKQVIPQVIEIQNKRKKAKRHKNKKARNYYTCNDTSNKKLGFVDFTDVVYTTYKNNDEEIIPTNNSYPIYVIVKSLNEILINNEFIDNKTEINKFNTELKKEINKTNLDDPDHGGDFILICLSFKRNLSFQDYISIKSKLINFNMENVAIRYNEYIY